MKGYSTFIVFCFILALSPILACTPNTAHTPVPQPTYTPVPLEMAHEDAVYLVAVEGVWTVIEGVVEKHMGSFTGEVSRPLGGDGEEKQQYQRYSLWSVKVFRYLVDPLDYEKITLRKLDGFVDEDGEPLPSRFPVRLSEGEHAIFFLSKKAWDPLEDDEYTLWEGSLFVQSKLTIDNGTVTWRDNEEAIEQFITRLQQYALEAGRAVPY